MRGVQLASPASQVDSRQHDLAIAIRDQRIDFAHHFLQLQRAAPAANVRNDAERAAIIAAVLHLQVGPRLLQRFAVEDRRRHEFGMREDVTDDDTGHLPAVRRPMLHSAETKSRSHPSRGATYFANSCLCELPMTRLTPGNAEISSGRALRVAARHQDLGLGILAMNAANGGAGVLIGGSGDRAGVEYDDFGLVRGMPARCSPRSSSCRSIAAPSAWVARHPKFST